MREVTDSDRTAILYNHDVPAPQLAETLDLTCQQVTGVKAASHQNLYGFPYKKRHIPAYRKRKIRKVDRTIFRSHIEDGWPIRHRDSVADVIGMSRESARRFCTETVIPTKPFRKKYDWGI